jgi:hypothetical protein
MEPEKHQIEEVLNPHTFYEQVDRNSLAEDQI